MRLAVAVVCVTSCGVGTVADEPAATPAPPSSTIPPPSTTGPVAFTVTNLPPPLTPAVRGPQIQLTEPPPAPTTTVPLDPCDEMAWYRTAAGLPAHFDKIGYRESRCTNTAISRTGCCVGWWQIHHINFRDHRTIDGLAACDATWLNIRGDTPEAKQRQACTAKVLFDVVGYQPWAATA